VELGMEVAEVASAHGRRLAPDSVGFDVPTSSVHGDTPLPLWEQLSG
jgi:hypothetical protein